MAVCGSGQATLSNDKQPGRRGKLHFFHMLDNLLPLALFAIAGSFTPGPNNVMVTASGQAFGFARSLPHMAGVTVGFAVLLIAFGLGLGQIFALYPGLHAALRIAGVIYLLYLAWRIATAGDPAAAGGPRDRLPFSKRRCSNGSM